MELIPLTDPAPISIHALLTESDQLRLLRRAAQIYFYPRSPYGERPCAGRIRCASMAFLSTLSLRRATIGPQVVADRVGISIHALLTESDSRGSVSMPRYLNFYPRSPYGERQSASYNAYLEDSISIHALLTESDHHNRYRFPHYRISIHALLTESDGFQGGQQLIGNNFYPRSPCGERPAHRFDGGEPSGISIHALLAESDFGKQKFNIGSPKFLSTLSLRRATSWQTCATDQQPNFYPRSPCGERLNQIISTNKRFNFYPRSPCGERQPE